MDMRLELVPLPSKDVDRSKAFYGSRAAPDMSPSVPPRCVQSRVWRVIADSPLSQRRAAEGCRLWVSVSLLEASQVLSHWSSSAVGTARDM